MVAPAQRLLPPRQHPPCLVQHVRLVAVRAVAGTPLRQLVLCLPLPGGRGGRGDALPARRGRRLGRGGPVPRTKGSTWKRVAIAAGVGVACLAVVILVG